METLNTNILESLNGFENFPFSEQVQFLFYVCLSKFTVQFSCNALPHLFLILQIKLHRPKSTSTVNAPSQQLQSFEKWVQTASRHPSPSPSPSLPPSLPLFLPLSLSPSLFFPLSFSSTINISLNLRLLLLKNMGKPGALTSQLQTPPHNHLVKGRVWNFVDEIRFRRFVSDALVLNNSLVGDLRDCEPAFVRREAD